MMYFQKTQHHNLLMVFGKYYSIPTLAHIYLNPKDVLKLLFSIKDISTSRTFTLSIRLLEN